ncbi:MULTISPECIES: RbtT/DalT/CsbX family MFS transporter [unclassified Streptomyces]|uniref:RbtT/DalT/CsbX family MFS transporter n=1 Tax=unclassified Streptomyces TaxID=2593676 RepID=UPI001F04747F|nr:MULTISPECIES: RbtT/DalT/CsbX family MFS transporter [unclassified Streptomyces]MCH0564125.1 MFS transporter [Streptomyces sp. MUM 2J]MCH0568428.1 MFS transporter [Streptomyces sp. MUM 136J]
MDAKTQRAHRGRLDRLGIPRPLAWGFPGVLIFMIGDGVESGYLSPYLTDQGVSGNGVALLFTVYGVSAGIAAWLSGALSDLWGPRRVMWAGLAVWVAFQLLFLVVAVPTVNYPLLLTAYGLRGFGFPLFAFGFLVWIAAATPAARLGSAAGWFWFAFTGGLPTLGSLVASGLVPRIGAYRTLWAALLLVAAGGLIALLGVRDPTGGRRLAPQGERPLATLLGSVRIVWRNPRIGVGCLVRIINTAPEFGYLVFLPIFFTETIGFSLSQWLRLLTVMFAVNIVFNLLFGLVGDRFGWRRTVAVFGGVGCAITTLLLYYVPTAAGDDYPLALLVAGLYGATLAGYVPLSALMPSLAPQHKGQAMAALNLGAGASAFVGPAIVGVLLAPLGVAGVMWVFAGLYASSAVMTTFLRLPGETADRGRRPQTERAAADVAGLAARAGGTLLGHPVRLRPTPGQDVELILFDVGGTLYDDDCFAQALYRAACDLGGNTVDEAEFWHLYDAQRERGAGSLHRAVAAAFVPGREQELRRLTRRHWHYPAEALYPDVVPVLTALAGRYRLGIVANSPGQVLAALERDGLRELLTVTALSDDVGAEKPDPAVFRHALARAAVPPERALHVGNRLENDVRPAHRIGMRTVWMLRGEASHAPTLRQLAEPDAVITTLTGLPTVLARLAGGDPPGGNAAR